MNFKSAFSKRTRVCRECASPSRTQQHCKDECDINNILSKYMKTGVLTHSNSKTPYYADLPEAMDYSEALNIVLDAESRFEALPSQIRDRFSNDPGQFLNFLSNPNNRVEAEKLGIIQPVSVSQPEQVDPQPPQE